MSKKYFCIFFHFRTFCIFFSFRRKKTYFGYWSVTYSLTHRATAFFLLQKVLENTQFEVIINNWTLPFCTDSRHDRYRKFKIHKNLKTQSNPSPILKKNGLSLENIRKVYVDKYLNIATLFRIWYRKFNHTFWASDFSQNWICGFLKNIFPGVFRVLF